MKKQAASEEFQFALGTVQSILNKLGVDEVLLDSVIVAPHDHAGEALISDRGDFDRFSYQFALKTGCVGYAFDDVALLTVRQFCQRYVDDSYPETPSAALSDEQYVLGDESDHRGGIETSHEFPICFVLGCPRSGTTLFRTMLNMHQEIWAPGELHLANFDNLADRARKLVPYIRQSILPEAASRFRESTSRFSERFKDWEDQNLESSEVYRRLHEADPSRLVVDKTPSYSSRMRTLERIGRQFRNAKFIFLVRNPHDVIRSYVKVQLHKGDQRFFPPGLNPHQMAEIIWVVHNANIAEFLREIPDERKCMVRYEDLVSDPGRSLMNVCSVLNLPYDSEMADPYKNRNGNVALGAGDPRVNLFDRVENRRPTDAFYPVGSRCRNLARDYGY